YGRAGLGLRVMRLMSCLHRVFHGGKQYGSSIVDYINRTLAGRSTCLGLSLVRLWSLGHSRGAADCRYRAAPHWPSLKGAIIQSRGAPYYSTPTYTVHLRYSSACSPWC